MRIPAIQADGLGDEFLHFGAHGGGNSGHQAINLAYMLGAKRILLLGFDMHGTHFFGDHPEGLKVTSPFPMFIQSLCTINPAKYGIEIINCTPGSAVECFPCINLHDALRL